ncbi:MAG: pseudouridine-5-phosphate glycosidase [Phycisphaerae bacterium]|nr:pseudouridine-5-phosphate glycosidase [Phycisphaerae bacterium]
MNGSAGVVTSPEVADALAEGRPVVGLETAVLTHGLPREPRERPTSLGPDHEAGRLLAGRDWDAGAPFNLESVRAIADAARHAGAVPATIGVIDGVLRIGLDDAELERLALDEAARKASTRDLAGLSVDGACAGTTVAASMRACRLASPRPIEVFATGGIGGVHRDWQSRPDISADLRALATEPVAVVASGAKVILDVTATLEALDSLGVPVLGFGTDRMPVFTAGLHDDLKVPHRIDDPETASRCIDRHWNSFGVASGILVANPCPADASIDSSRLDALVDTGLAEASSLGIEGADVTPFLLSSMLGAEGTDPLSSNVALLVSNASLAGRIAIHLSARS